ncbi:protein MAIN-LIKE 1-like [Gossypium hirsutum]|uniref:Protein MAIN-LIKE 1-like n=1 Tax=Gossypium hirsutum TaxID=3635 RepID=A0A1U8MX10_GOSHI|nr:protein MAIN-LIKE 1-like [Gossypium hirsutum]
MAASLIRFDDKHIFAAQLVMVDNRVLNGFIHNMGKHTILDIRGHLQAVGFLHVSSMSGGCKPDLQLISALVERRRPETHTFHIPCGECTITLEDTTLQLGLSVDGTIITRFRIVLDKVTLYRSLLGKVPSKFEGDQISMNWFKANFDELLEDRTEEVIQQYDRAYIMRLIGGILMLEKSQNLMHVRWLRHVVDFNDRGKLSWGFFVLSTLYREMCQATNLRSTSIDGSRLL